MRRVVWMLLFLAGCMRGCSAPSCNSGCEGGGSGRSLDCTSNDDCEDRERCHEGICKDPDSIKSSERCLDTPECKRYGACRPGLTRSFLGANSIPTCLIERGEDCAASELCKVHGRCELGHTGFYNDGYCAATTAKQCAASSRCASHDECKLDAERKECVRSWDDCTGEPMPGFESGANLGAAWEPGTVDDAILACRIEDNYQQKSSLVRIGTRCLRGPTLGSNTPFLMRTKLAVGDRIEIAFQADPKRGTSSDSGYVRATYTGSSSFTSGTELPKLTCNVVPADAAKANAAGMIVRIEKGLVRLRNETARLVAEPPEAGGIRRVLGEAAQWIANDPQIARLQAALEAELVGWRKKLDAVINKLVISDRGPKDSTVSVAGYVCGEALHKRLGKDVKPEDCGVEIAVHATTQMQLGTGISDLSYLKFAWSGPQATVIDAVIVDAGTKTKPPASSLVLERGEDGVILVVPAQLKDLAGARLLADYGTTVLKLDR